MMNRYWYDKYVYGRTINIYGLPYLSYKSVKMSFLPIPIFLLLYTIKNLPYSLIFKKYSRVTTLKIDGSGTPVSYKKMCNFIYNKK